MMSKGSNSDDKPATTKEEKKNATTAFSVSKLSFTHFTTLTCFTFHLRFHHSMLATLHPFSIGFHTFHTFFLCRRCCSKLVKKKTLIFFPVVWKCWNEFRFVERKSSTTKTTTTTRKYFTLKYRQISKLKASLLILSSPTCTRFRRIHCKRIYRQAKKKLEIDS